MPNAVRHFLAVAGGVVAAMVLVTVGDALAGVIHPLPPGLDFSNRDAVRAAIAGMPLAAYVVLVGGWSAAAGVGAWTAARTAPSHRLRAGLIVAAVLLASTIANLTMLPHPVWMWPVALLAIPVAGMVGARAGATGTLPVGQPD
jgi:hypothetical protein